jgi:hypothetical protein
VRRRERGKNWGQDKELQKLPKQDRERGLAKN